ncbi:MAG: hypothetical protein NZ518_11510, partial [Dehalococcoidia bacterium]|nr:hypothetical protein [Dehalococcoidia bacterium]
MNLAGLLPTIVAEAAFRDLLRAVEPTGHVAVASLPAALPAVIAALTEATGRPVFVVTGRVERARGFAEQLQCWGAPAVVLPEPDGLPFERFVPDPVTTAHRLAALAELASPTTARVVIASAYAALPLTIPPETLRARTLAIAVGQRLSLRDLTTALVRAGYELVTQVSQPGMFARRGGIVDVFPPGRLEPIRLELFGDEVESVRSFDPVTQRSTSLLSSARIPPARERLVTPTALPALDLSTLTDDARERFETDLARLAAGEPFDGVDFYAGLLPHATVF